MKKKKNYPPGLTIFRRRLFDHIFSLLLRLNDDLQLQLKCFSSSILTGFRGFKNYD